MAARRTDEDSPNRPAGISPQDTAGLAEATERRLEPEIASGASQGLSERHANGSGSDTEAWRSASSAASEGSQSSASAADVIDARLDELENQQSPRRGGTVL